MITLKNKTMFDVYRPIKKKTHVFHTAISTYFPHQKIKKPEKTKIKRESFLDKLTKNLQDFLDNAE